MTMATVRTSAALALSSLLAAALITACGKGEPAARPSPSTSPSSSASPLVHLVGQGENANLGLFVSNQSFADDPVHLTIAIDGVTLVDDDFEVGSQHNWIGYSVVAPPGDHHVTAMSDTGATMDADFSIPEGKPRYAIIDYWNYEDAEGRHIDWQIQNQVPAFS